MSTKLHLLEILLDRQSSKFVAAAVFALLTFFCAGSPAADWLAAKTKGALAGSNKQSDLHKGPALWEAGDQRLAIKIAKDGSCTVALYGKTWFTTSTQMLAVHLNGQWYFADSNSASNKLVYVSSRSGSGQDKLGHYRAYSIQWLAGKTAYQTTIRSYENKPILVFAQSYPDGAKETCLPDNNRDNHLLPQSFDYSVAQNRNQISAFPALFLGQNAASSLHYLVYKGYFAQPEIGARADRLRIDAGRHGTECGAPLILFDSSLHTAVISPLNHFMTSEMSMQSQLLTCGTHGEVSEIPQGFSQETIIYAGDGINKTLSDWGSQLLTLGGKSRASENSDPSLNYLGYWTDNGAYYYYKPESDKTFADTFIDLAADFRQRAIPVRYYQLDSWWYHKGPDEGVSLWQPRADVFPDGIAHLHKALALPFVMHNRWWSTEAPRQYKYPFFQGDRCSLPADYTFWQYLMNEARNCGCVVYEQDWLNVQYDRADFLRNSVAVADQWLSSMDRAATSANLHIQYCMPLPQYYLESTKLSAVDQIRASDDYHPGNEQWRIGVNSMLAWSLGLLPYKDTFWSTEYEPGSPYGANAREPNPRLQLISAILSCGQSGRVMPLAATKTY